jgi:3'(2'), 5'-bisphosphate nucleotidase
MLSKNDIDKIKEIILEASDIATSIIVSGVEVTYKSDGSPVTNGDIEVSKYIMKHLRDVIPGMPIISEEEEIPENFGRNFWLVDPIDGTRSYIKGEPLYTVNIGLILDGVPVFGFVKNPATGHLYYTSETGEMIIECQGEQVPCNMDPRDLKAVISTHASSSIKEIIQQHDIISYEIIPGAIKFCIIASGDADLYPRHGNTMEWDTAAGHALIRAVGGEIFNLEGGVLQYGKPQLLNNGFIAYSKRLLGGKRDS